MWYCFVHGEAQLPHPLTLNSITYVDTYTAYLHKNFRHGMLSLQV